MEKEKLIYHSNYSGEHEVELDIQAYFANCALSRWKPTRIASLL